MFLIAEHWAVRLRLRRIMWSGLRKGWRQKGTAITEDPDDHDQLVEDHFRADRHDAMSDHDPAAAARELRHRLAAYVAAMHEAAVSAANDAGGTARDLLLADEPFTVAIIAGRSLHLVATRDDLPTLRHHEQVLVGKLPPLTWSVRFFDATVIPGLGAQPTRSTEAGDPEPDGAPDVTPADIGIETVIYHLRLDPTGELSTHHAMHAGTSLAHSLRRHDQPE